MYAGQRAGREIGESVAREYTDAGGDPCAASLFLVGAGVTLLGVIFVSVGYSDYNAYAKGRDPTGDFVSLGPRSCRIENIYYQTFERYDRRGRSRILEWEQEGNGSGDDDYGSVQTNQQARMLPPIPDRIKCFESWSTTFSVVNSSELYAGNHTDYFDRVACGNSGKDVYCDDCNKFLGEHQVMKGGDLQQNDLVECWVRSHSGAFAWDCVNSNCLRMRDPLDEFHEDSQLSRRNILAGWILFGVGILFCFCGCGCEYAAN